MLPLRTENKSSFCAFEIFSSRTASPAFQLLCRSFWYRFCVVNQVHSSATPTATASQAVVRCRRRRQQQIQTRHFKSRSHIPSLHGATPCIRVRVSSLECTWSAYLAVAQSPLSLPPISSRRLCPAVSPPSLLLPTPSLSSFSSSSCRSRTHPVNRPPAPTSTLACPPFPRPLTFPTPR